MVALLRHREHAPVAPAPARRERHLRLVPPPEPPASDEARRLRETRWTTALLVVATVALFALWLGGVYGAADEAWWGALVAVVLAGVVGFGIVVLRRIR